MAEVQIQIDGVNYSVDKELSVRRAAIGSGIYIPGVCSHPELDSFKAFNWSEEVWQGATNHRQTPPLLPPTSGGESNDWPHCELCLVSVNGSDPQRACTTKVEAGMVVETATSVLLKARQESLKKILARHPHACLTCAQREGCDRVQCSMNVPVEERCCELLGRCEIGKVAEFIGIPADTPAYHNEQRPIITDEPLFIRNYELCISCLRCVRVCRDVRQVDVYGSVMTDDGVKVGTQNGPMLNDAHCRYCGACVAVCPTGALQDRAECEPLVNGLAPCVAACPLEIDVPGYLDLISQGLEYEALELIRQKAVLPGVLGYACFHPCEDSCRRSSLDESASICSLKRYVADVAGDEPATAIKSPPTGKSVAVVGAGPAGLASAAELLRLGHDVTVFEQAEKLGGMLVQSIPEFRLPQSVVERDLKLLYDLGLKGKTGVELGVDITPDQLKSDGFDATIIAIGLSEPASLGLENEGLTGVQLGLDFLRTVKLGDSTRLTGSTLVIGGGSVAVDTAMSALRLGSDSVTLVCLEGESEIPASNDELNAAIQEGIGIEFRWGVSSIEAADAGKLESVVLKQCVSVFDSRGNFAPKYDESVLKTVECDNLIISIGQRVKPELKEWLNGGEGSFVAGDVRTGPGSIVAAMADGRRKAFEVHKHLTGQEAEPQLDRIYQSDSALGKDTQFLGRSRPEPLSVSPTDRIASMEVYESTLTEQIARDEAARCLRCHLRASIMSSPLPPDPWYSFTRETGSDVPVAEGVLILADETKLTVKIIGAADLNSIYSEQLDEDVDAAYCRWELDPMYTKRESELMQVHLQEHGEMPGSDDMDDLF